MTGHSLEEGSRVQEKRGLQPQSDLLDFRALETSTSRGPQHWEDKGSEGATLPWPCSSATAPIKPLRGRGGICLIYSLSEEIINKQVTEGNT